VDPMLEITLTTIVAYGSFIAGETLGASGVIATVTAGLLCGDQSAQRRLSPSARAAVVTFWEYAAFALNSIVFLLIGFQVRIPALVAAWESILVAYLVVTIARTIVTYALAAVLPKREKLAPRWTAVLAWSGLRGSLAMVLALSLPVTLTQREFIVTLTFGVVILSILLQGLTVASLLRWLGISQAPGPTAESSLATVKPPPLEPINPNAHS
jgi:Na+:H+ antiporter